MFFSIWNAISCILRQPQEDIIYKPLALFYFTVMAKIDTIFMNSKTTLYSNDGISLSDKDGLNLET